MSGAIKDVRAEDLTAINTESGVWIKTVMGRGRYAKGIYVRGIKMHTMKWAFWMDGNYWSHPDGHYNPRARPVVEGINYRDIVTENVTMAAQFKGILGDPFTRICISNATISMNPKLKEAPWTCSDVQGIISGVAPRPCNNLPAVKAVTRVNLKNCVYKVKKNP